MKTLDPLSGDRVDELGLELDAPFPFSNPTTAVAADVNASLSESHLPGVLVVRSLNAGYRGEVHTNSYTVCSPPSWPRAATGA